MMKTQIDKQIAATLQRASNDPLVGPCAIKMLAYYAAEYRLLHRTYGGAHFDEEVEVFAAPSEDIQETLELWDGKDPIDFKGPFKSVAEAIRVRVFELTYDNLVSLPVRGYWHELHEAILTHLYPVEDATAQLSESDRRLNN